MTTQPNFYDKLAQTFSELFGTTCPPLLNTTKKPDLPQLENQSLDSSFVRLGDTYIHLRNYTSAFNCYRDALRINSNNSDAFNRMILIPRHLIDNPSKAELTRTDLINLSLNDTFRQTLIGGFVVLSKTLSLYSEENLEPLFNQVSTLSPAYFEKHSNEQRSFGAFVNPTGSYVWMINHCNNSPDNNPREDFPVLVLLTRSEYQKLRALFI